MCIKTHNKSLPCWGEGRGPEGFEEPISKPKENGFQLSEWRKKLDAEILKLYRLNSQKLFGRQVYQEAELNQGF